jgi:hypothetical protein
MKALVISSVFLLCILLRANATDTIFIKFISDKGDTVNVYLSEVVKIDPVNHLMELSSDVSEKLTAYDYTDGEILLNTGNEKWVNVTIYDPPSDVRSDPSVVIGPNKYIFSDNRNVIEIWGDTWSTVAEKYGKVGTIPL